MGIISLFVNLVLAGVSLRGVPRVLAVVAAALGWSIPIPHWTTGRLWLLRLGHAQLTANKTAAADWVWLIDHSVQIGQEKFLAILGIRLADLPPPGESLRYEDMALLALIPRKSWTRQEVDDALEATALQTCVPRAVVNDHGVDVSGGVQLFQGRHPETVEIYDAKHKAACVLKRCLGNDPRWQAFQQQLAGTRCAIQQTELAFLVPPSPKLKARFMNLESLLNWAAHVIAVLKQPPASVLKTVTPERLSDKLGWLTEYATAIAEWSEWQTIINIVVKFVNCQGIYRGAVGALRETLPSSYAYDSSRQLAEELVAFVKAQTFLTRRGERLPGSTEILESSFGKFKQLEKQQSRGGFTSLVLGFGAMLGNISTTVIEQAMKRSHTKNVIEWCKEHLGVTLFAQRKAAFAASATKGG